MKPRARGSGRCRSWRRDSNPWPADYKSVRRSTGNRDDSPKRSAPQAFAVFRACRHVLLFLIPMRIKCGPSEPEEDVVGRPAGRGDAEAAIGTGSQLVSRVCSPIACRQLLSARLTPRSRAQVPRGFIRLVPVLRGLPCGSRRNDERSHRIGPPPSRHCVQCQAKHRRRRQHTVEEHRCPRAQRG